MEFAQNVAGNSAAAHNPPALPQVPAVPRQMLLPPARAAARPTARRAVPEVSSSVKVALAERFCSKVWACSSAPPARRVVSAKRVRAMASGNVARGKGGALGPESAVNARMAAPGAWWRGMVQFMVERLSRDLPTGEGASRRRAAGTQWGEGTARRQ